MDARDRTRFTVAKATIIYTADPVAIILPVMMVMIGMHFSLVMESIPFMIGDITVPPMTVSNLAEVLLHRTFRLIESEIIYISNIRTRTP